MVLTYRMVPPAYEAIEGLYARDLTKVLNRAMTAIKAYPNNTNMQVRSRPRTRHLTHPTIPLHPLHFLELNSAACEQYVAGVVLEERSEIEAAVQHLTTGQRRYLLRARYAQSGTNGAYGTTSART